MSSVKIDEIVGFERKGGDQTMCLSCWGPINPEDGNLENFIPITIDDLQRNIDTITFCDECGTAITE